MDQNHKVKRIYTLASAAKELNLSQRHLIRYIKERTDWKPSKIGSRLAYVFGPDQFAKLKQFVAQHQVVDPMRASNPMSDGAV